MKKIVTLDKFNNISVAPDFGRTEVVFYRIINSTTCKVGEEWEFEIVRKTPTGKTDKKGTPIVNVSLKAIKRVETPCPHLVKFAGDFNNPYFKFPIYSGESVVREEKIPANIVFECQNPSTWGDMAGVIATAKAQYGDKELKEVIAVVKYRENRQSFIPEDVWEEGQRLWRAYNEKIEAEKRAAEQKDAEREEYIRNGRKDVPENIVREFIVHGVGTKHFCIVPQSHDFRDPYYGHEYDIFEVNGFRWELGLVTFDEPDYEEWAETFKTSAGELSTRENSVYQKIAFYASHPEPHKAILPIFKVPRPSLDEIVYTEYVPVNERNPKRDNEVMERLKDKAEEYKREQEVIEYDIEGLVKIRYTYYMDIECGIGIFWEEGIGAKDATVWESRQAYLVVRRKCKREAEFAEIVNEKIKEDVKKALGI